MTFQEYQKQEHNYECITTFWEDFAIADRFGINAVKDTFNRAFNEWKNNYRYLTELVIVLNHRCWMHYNQGRIDISKVYSSRYYQAHNFALDNLNGEEYEYYFRITD